LVLILVVVVVIYRTRVTLKRTGEVIDLVPPPSKVHNLIFGRTWIDSPGEMIVTNITTGDKAVLYFQPCGWFGYVTLSAMQFCLIGLLSNHMAEVAHWIRSCLCVVKAEQINQ
jgi:hypothetical protein